MSAFIGSEVIIIIVIIVTQNHCVLCYWQTPGSTKHSPGYRLLTARHVTRPQAEFHDKIDNSDRPFVPKLASKPNALLPLSGKLLFLWMKYVLLCVVINF